MSWHDGCIVRHAWPRREPGIRHTTSGWASASLFWSGARWGFLCRITVKNLFFSSFLQRERHRHVLSVAAFRQEPPWTSMWVCFDPSISNQLTATCVNHVSGGSRRGGAAHGFCSEVAAEPRLTFVVLPRWLWHLSMFSSSGHQGRYNNKAVWFAETCLTFEHHHPTNLICFLFRARSSLQSDNVQDHQCLILLCNPALWLRWRSAHQVIAAQWRRFSPGASQLISLSDKSKLSELRCPGHDAAILYLFHFF